MQDLEHPGPAAPSLAVTDLPPVPVPAAEATSLQALLDPELARFAMTFDGYAQFGSHWPETLEARREEWEREGTLPRDVEALRGLLFLSFRQERFVELDESASFVAPGDPPAGPADPDAITDARRAHEAFKQAILAKLRALLAG